jgi:CRP-like cAMP-binding protein
MVAMLDLLAAALQSVAPGCVRGVLALLQSSCTLPAHSTPASARRSRHESAPRACYTHGRVIRAVRPTVDQQMTTDTDRITWDAARRAALLATTRLFAGLPPEVLAAVAGRCRPRPIRRGAVVVLAGDPAEAVHILAAGRVKLVQEAEDGRAAILRLARPGEPLDLAAGWDEAREPATAIALDDGVVLRLPAADFEALIAGYPAVALAVVRELAARLRDAEARVRELQTERVDQRIARTLLRLTPAAGPGSEGGAERAISLSRQDLADLCGATLSTASRILADWHRRGIVVAGRERVVIRRLDELAAIATRRAPPDIAEPPG